jgi:DNA replication protein DnaC
METKSDHTPASITNLVDAIRDKSALVKPRPVVDEEKIEEKIVNGRSCVANDRLGIPARFIGKSLSNFQGYEAEVDLARQAISRGKSAFISGPPGVGKTHMAYGLALLYYSKHFAIRSIPVFISSARLLLDLKSSIDEGNERATIRHYGTTPFLVIDDLGAERISDWSRQQMYLILDWRYNDMRQTVITSNLTLEKVAELIDDRLASRLVEMGEIITLKGGDWRVERK